MATERSYDIDDVAIPFMGPRVSRYESRAKVTGAAAFAADEPLASTLHAVLVTIPQAKGTVTRAPISKPVTPVTPVPRAATVPENS